MSFDYFNDPVEYEDGKGWFFWDETWTEQCGFYQTQKEARKALREYSIEYLGIDIPSSEGVEDDEKK
jgi:hypothetical protein